MSTHKGRYAELYDTFYADKPYAEEAAFVHSCFLKHGTGAIQRVLELACGTGSHAFALENLGYKVVATDYSNDMLEYARRKARQISSSVDFRREDMRNLELRGETFDAAICLFDSIGFVVTNDGLIRVLEGVWRSLRPGGLFVFEFWHAPAMLRKFDPVRANRWSYPNGHLLRVSETSLDCLHQLARVRYTVYELRTDGTYTSFEETQLNRYFMVQEASGWLTRCGFEPVEWFAGFTGLKEINEETWHVVAVSRRSPSPVHEGE
jgi:SAM-dependent methyltransferase